MAEHRYYYLKLTENFFNDDEIKVLESMENGYLYCNILLKLYLKSLKNDGKLVFNDYIPYNTKMIATITGHNIDIVEKAIKVFQALHLIDIFDNGTIYMLNIQNFIGSISSEGVRKANYRERIKLEKKKSGTLSQDCPNIDIISNSIIEKENNNTKVLSKEKDISSNINSRSSRSLSLTNTQSENETNIDNVSISFDNAPIGEHSSSNNNKAVTCDIEDPVADAVEYSMKSIKMELDRYIMELFDKTWAIYPRKVSKEQAKKTWAKKMKCCKTPQGVRNKAAQIYKLLMSHIAMWRNEHGDDGEGARPLEYIPHFSSWLNNEIPDD